MIVTATVTVIVSSLQSSLGCFIRGVVFVAISALKRGNINIRFSLVLASTAPINTSATVISATSILLTWNHPISFNGILHDYKIRYKLASDSRYDISFSAGGRPFYVVSSLSPFTAYDFQVSSFLVRYSIIL